MASESNGLKLTNVNILDCGSHHIRCRSVSWSGTGAYLAMGCSDRLARIWTVDSAAREVLTVSGHAAAVHKVQFHPTEATQLCTAAQDSTVRLWDVRNATQRATGKIDLQQGNAAVNVQWCPSSTILAVEEVDGAVYIYDTRKLTAGTKTSRYQHVFKATLTGKPESLAFSPDGNYLIADCQQSGKRPRLQIWPWKDKDTTETMFYPVNSIVCSMQFSPDGKYFAAGGLDASVAVFDSATMCCMHAVSRPLKFIRSVAFSHDSRILATSSEDEMIDLSDTATGALVGLVPTAPTGQQRGKGADALDFHPKEYMLAMARLDYGQGQPPPPMAVVKLSVGSSQ